MDSKVFIERKLRELIEIFPDMKCLYEYEEKHNHHTIEIKPKNVFENDNLYIDIEVKLYKEFFDRFIDQSLTIIAGESIFPIKPEFILYGKQFKE